MLTLLPRSKDGTCGVIHPRMGSTIGIWPCLLTIDGLMNIPLYGTQDNLSPWHMW